MYGMLLIWVIFVLMGISVHAVPKPQNRMDLDERQECPCGSNILSKQTRVVGGVDTDEGQFPYASGLIYHTLKNEDPRKTGLPLPYCGGTLISDRHILTAAHCLRDRHPEEILLDVGDYNLKLDTDEKLLRNSARILSHPDYYAPEFRHDVALIEMAEPVDWDGGLKASYLASPEVPLSKGTKVTVYGWGRLHYSGGRPTILQSVEIPIMEREQCQKGFRTTITEGMLCAGGEAGRDACIGDSGSGLSMRLDDKYALVGVVSFGRNCALPNVAGVYTRLGNYVDWIYEETRNSKCKPCITP